MNGEEKQSFIEPTGCFGKLQQKSFGHKLSNLASPGVNTKQKNKEALQGGVAHDVELLRPKAERKFSKVLNHSVFDLRITCNFEILEKIYERLSCCVSNQWSYPIFIVTVSVIQIGVFISFYTDINSFEELHQYQSAMSYSKLIFSPYKRTEVWRFVSYQFLHANFNHIVGNIIGQLLLGIPLEMLHGTLKIALLYTVGKTVRKRRPIE